MWSALGKRFFLAGVLFNLGDLVVLCMYDLKKLGTCLIARAVYGGAAGLFLCRVPLHPQAFSLGYTVIPFSLSGIEFLHALGFILPEANPKPALAFRRARRAFRMLVWPLAVMLSVPLLINQ